MIIRTSGSRIRLSGKISSGLPTVTAEPGIGQIFRVVNTSGITAGAFQYTDINGNTSSTNTLNPDGVEYILVQSGSLSDNPNAGDPSPLFTVTNLLITSSNPNEPLTFTEELITTTGAGTWTKPSGVTQVIVECWGGGAAGGGVTNNPAVGGGGGGGQYSRKYLEYTSPSIGIGYSIGTGGTGGTGAGGNGGDTTWNTNTVIAKGGTAGTANQDPAGAPGGLGNIAGSIGDIIYFGSNGGDGGTDRGGAIFGGIGGGGAGSAENGSGGLSSLEYGGEPGEGGFVVAGGNGLIYGGGGGGASTDTATNRSGGSGAQGLIRLIYR